MIEQTDLARRIDASIGDGPPPPALEGLVAAGRRARTRRRIAAGSSVLAVVLIAGGGAWAVTGQGTDGADLAPSVATESSAPLADSADDVQVASDDQRNFFSGGTSVMALADGTLLVKPGWTVSRLEVKDPRDDQHRVWGIESTRGDRDKTQWIMLSWEPGYRSSAMSGPLGTRFATFNEWLQASYDEFQPGGEVQTKPDEPPPAEYTDDGQLKLRDGVTLVRRVDNPMELTAPKQSVGLVLDEGGTRLWMLLQDTPAGGSSASVKAGKTFPTFDLWLADVLVASKSQPTGTGQR